MVGIEIRLKTNGTYALEIKKKKKGVLQFCDFCLIGQEFFGVSQKEQETF